MTRIKVQDLTKSFVRANGNTLCVLAGTTFEVSPGSVTAIVGPNGCGKSTLLALIAGLLRADSGNIFLSGSLVGGANVGYVWQNYRASLLPWLSAEENVAFPLKLHGVKRQERLSAAIKLFKMADVQFDVTQPIYRLSGGQQQLVCLLRALVRSPDVLLVDEPTSALDLQAKWSFFEHCEHLRTEHPRTTLWVSHDPDEAALAADVILLMSADGGRIEEILVNSLPRPRTVSMLSDPKHLDCRRRILDFIVRANSFRAAEL